MLYCCCVRLLTNKSIETNETKTSIDSSTEKLLKNSNKEPLLSGKRTTGFQVCVSTIVIAMVHWLIVGLLLFASGRKRSVDHGGIHDEEEFIVCVRKCEDEYSKRARSDIAYRILATCAKRAQRAAHQRAWDR
jgi:hypothetical protein